MLRMDTKKLIQGLKEVNPANQEYLEMLRFFFLMENGELDLSSFKEKTLENILERYYNRESHIFEKSIRQFSRIQKSLTITKGRVNVNEFI